MKPFSPQGKPEWVLKLTPAEEIRLDITALVETGLEPLSTVLRLVDDIRPCQRLHLVFSQEPVIIYKVLEDKGFEHYAEKSEGTWDVYFRQKDCPCPGQVH